MLQSHVPSHGSAALALDRPSNKCAGQGPAPAHYPHGSVPRRYVPSAASQRITYDTVSVRAQAEAFKGHLLEKHLVFFQVRGLAISKAQPKLGISRIRVIVRRECGAVYSTTELAPTAWSKRSGRVADQAETSWEMATDSPPRVRAPVSVVSPTMAAGMPSSPARART